MRHIIVDGYNVIRADPRLQSLERSSLEQAREVLARTLSSSPRLARDRITVVFDGARGTRTHVHGHRIGRVDVVYSARGETADDVIVVQAGALAGREQVVVVSNDLEVRERCRAAGCEISSSDNLLNQVPGRPKLTTDRDEEDLAPALSTVKKGNPRRSPRGAKRKREIRF